MQTDYDVMIVGAGAAGIVAAGRAAELGARVLVLEKMNSVGRKLLITGKGRCNISNDAHQSAYFKNIFPAGKFLKHAFKAFFSKDIVQLLNTHGLQTTTERGNRIFPTSNKAQDVVVTLLTWLKKYPVDIVLDSKVEELLIEQNKVVGVKVMSNNKQIVYRAKSVILCTGGKSYPATGSTGDGYELVRKLGHSITKVRPALVPLVTMGNTAKQLQGLSLKNVNASLWINERKQYDEFGEMLFAHFGLTGPIILSLSRFAVDALDAAHKVKVVLDLKPALDEQKLDARLLRDIDANGKKQVENICKLWMPSKLIPVILANCQIDGKKAGHQLNAKERRKLMHQLKNFEFEVIAYRGFGEAIITAGGIDTNEIDGKTMQSTIVDNLYFAGEIIDQDAKTGGFNLQIAWSTAWLAAEASVQAIINSGSE